MKHILITGGAGFLGINLLNKLISNECSIIVVDNFITSNKELFHHFLNKHKLKKNIHFIFFDITSPYFISYMMRNFNHIHEIYHLASLASPVFYKKYPIETLDVGYLGTKNILELCKHFSSKLLYTSTSEVYGDSLKHPQNENYYGNVNTIGERSPYDESKRISETLVNIYTKLYNLDTRIVRIFNTYGPYMQLNDGRIITEIINSFKNNTTLTIYGDGSQTRCFNFVDDTINMIVSIMESNYKLPVNVGNDNEISINQLVEIFKTIFKNVSLNIQYLPIDIDDPKVRKPDLSLNNKIIGKFEFTSLEEGLKKTISYFNR